MFTTTQLRIADIHDSDDTLQTAASIAKRAIPAVLQEAEDADDDDLDDDFSDQGDKDTRLDNDIVVLRSQITAGECLAVATQNRLMLETLLENQAQ